MAAKKVDTQAIYTLEELKKIIKSTSKNKISVGDSEIASLHKVDTIQTGLPTFDYLGGGGITRGRITILAGNPSSAKSTSTLQIVAALIRKIKEEEAVNGSKTVLYYDPEGAYDWNYANALGIDQEYMSIVTQLKVIEDVFSHADGLISLGLVGGLVIDSLDGLIARKVEDNAYGNSMGSQSGALAMHLPKLFGKIVDHNVTTIIIKQARVKMGTMSPGEVITFNGGKALRHLADSIYIMKQLSNRNLNYRPIQIKAEKTRSARMGLTLDLPLGECGVDIARDLVKLAVDFNVITVAGGGWTTFKDVREQGLDKFVALVKANQDLFNDLKNEVYSSVINAKSIIGMSNTEGEEIKVELDGEEE